MALRTILKLLGVLVLILVGLASCGMSVMIAAFNDTGEPFEVIWPTMRAFLAVGSIALVAGLVLLIQTVVVQIRANQARGRGQPTGKSTV